MRPHNTEKHARTHKHGLIVQVVGPRTPANMVSQYKEGNANIVGLSKQKVLARAFMRPVSCSRVAAVASSSLTFFVLIFDPVSIFDLTSLTTSSDSSRPFVLRTESLCPYNNLESDERGSSRDRQASMPTTSFCNEVFVSSDFQWTTLLLFVDVLGA